MRAVPSRASITFSGLMSRCTMPIACAAARPSAICTARSSSRFSGSGTTRQLIAQRLPFEPFGDEVVRAAVDVGVVDAENVGMIERAGGAAFGDQSALAIGIGRHLGMQQLDRHIALEPRIPRLEHFAHAAGADARDDAIRTDLFARWDGGHRRGHEETAPRRLEAFEEPDVGSRAGQRGEESLSPTNEKPANRLIGDRNGTEVGVEHLHVPGARLDLDHREVPGRVALRQRHDATAIGPPDHRKDWRRGQQLRACRPPTTRGPGRRRSAMAIHLPSGDHTGREKTNGPCKQLHALHGAHPRLDQRRLAAVVVHVGNPLAIGRPRRRIAPWPASCCRVSRSGAPACRR